MEFKGTKGKWNLDGYKDDLYLVSSDCGEQGNIICLKPDDDAIASQEKWIANAQLIASAPEMFEMLKDLLNSESLSLRAKTNIEQLLTKITTL